MIIINDTGTQQRSTPAGRAQQDRIVIKYRYVKSLKKSHDLKSLSEVRKNSIRTIDTGGFLRKVTNTERIPWSGTDHGATVRDCNNSGRAAARVT